MAFSEDPESGNLENQDDGHHRPVVQCWVSINPGFNPLFKFLCFYMSVALETSETKTTIDPDKSLKKQIALP